MYKQHTENTDYPDAMAQLVQEISGWLDATEQARSAFRGCSEGEENEGICRWEESANAYRLSEDGRKAAKASVEAILLSTCTRMTSAA